MQRLRKSLIQAALALLTCFVLSSIASTKASAHTPLSAAATIDATSCDFVRNLQVAARQLDPDNEDLVVKLEVTLDTAGAISTVEIKGGTASRRLRTWAKRNIRDCTFKPNVVEGIAKESVVLLVFRLKERFSAGNGHLLCKFPEYPPSASYAGIDGTVDVRIFLDGSGSPQRAEVALSSGVPAIDGAAIQAASSCTPSTSPLPNESVVVRFLFKS